MTAILMALLTASRAKAARACKRLHHLEYDEGYRPVTEEDVLRFGSLVHAGLEAWWNAKKAGQPQDAWLDAALAALVGEMDPYDLARAQVAMTGYHLRWKDEPYEVIAVEVQFETDLRNPSTGRSSRTWRLAGKIDVVGKDLRDGLVRVVEHKTCGEDCSPGSDYWKRLRLDGQVSVYFEGAASLGYAASACLYDVLAKPALRPSAVPILDADGVKQVFDLHGERVRTKDGKKWRETGDTAQGFTLQTRTETPDEFRERLANAVAEDPARYFARGDVVRLESEMNEALFDIWQLGLEIRAGQVANQFPRNDGACVRYGRTCQFFAVCTKEASLDDPTRFKKLESVHPELAQEVGDAVQP
jgi:hypothetical protein